MKHKKLLITVGIVIVFLIGSMIYSKEKNMEQSELPKVSKELLSFFEENIEFEEIITYAQEDINGDSREDLVVVYKKDNKVNQMVVIINDNNNIYSTEPKLAPKENVVIEFRDIDDKPPMEVVISGSKNGNVGYAIYRLENEELIDLFGEGMDACC